MEYTVDERGKRKEVVLGIDEYERLIRSAGDAEDSRIAREELAKLESGETTRTLRRPRGPDKKVSVGAVA